MAKIKNKTAFFCSECGMDQSKWFGVCPACGAAGTATEQKIEIRNTSGKVQGISLEVKPVTFDEISTDEENRLVTGIGELDVVLGGGIVPGSLTLVGGDPGIGKSTLLLQVCKALGDKNIEVLYISGEESLSQIKLRAQRIGTMTDHVMVLAETCIENAREAIRRSNAKVVVIDSIQTMFSETLDATPGSVSQVKEVTNLLMRLAKEFSVSVFIVGHVTKEGTVAGPRMLEHMVDTVLYFEGDRHASYRMLRGVKNRFGSTNEIGVFEMKNEGLVEVPNPSEFMLNGRPEDSSGSVVGCTMEGTRPILIEIQALVSKTNFGFPRRQSAGSDMNRLNLMMTVLEKRVGVQIGDCDAYVNIAGGMKITEPGVDLSVIIAVMSSYSNKVIPGDVVAFGEVGLSGEVRAVSGAPFRVSECKKLGFKKVILPYGNMEACRETCGIELLPVKSIAQAINCLNVLQNKD